MQAGRQEWAWVWCRVFGHGKGPRLGNMAGEGREGSLGAGLQKASNARPGNGHFLL